MCIRVTSPRKFVKMQIAGPHLGFLFHWYGLGPNNLIFFLFFTFILFFGKRIIFTCLNLVLIKMLFSYTWIQMAIRKHLLVLILSALK